MVEDGDRVMDPTIDLTLVLDRLYIFSVCISFSSRAVAVTQEFEQLIAASALRFYYTLHRLTVTDPTSTVLEDSRRRYSKAFPGGVGFMDLPSRHTNIMIDALIRGD